MRSSSMKSIIATLSIAIALTLAVPALGASRTIDPRTSRANGTSILRIVREWIKRVGGITTNSGPSVPIGTPGTGGSSSGTGGN